MCSFYFSGTSLISKVVLLSEYRHVCQRLKIQSTTSEASYYALKQTAKEYHQKKRAMAHYLEQKKFGYWSNEKKHLEQFRWQSTVPPIQRNIAM
jgi:predicted solute-binding protein